jgi:dicarboxylate transporter 10
LNRPQVWREEGFLKLFNGADWATTRAVMMTIGQLCFYDVIKAQLLTTGYFGDNTTTHFTASLCAVSNIRNYLVPF